MSPRADAAQQARNARVDRMVELFAAGHTVDYVCEQGVTGGWTRADVLTLVQQRGWPLDGSGRLPQRMRPAQRPVPRPSRRRTDRVVPAVGPVPVEALPPVLEAIAGFAAHQLAHEARASTALDGETHVVGGAYTAAEPRRVETPTEGTATGTVRADAAGTAPDESGHGNAGPDAQPLVSPSRSHPSEYGGRLGASDAPAEPSATVADVPLTAEEIRARVDAIEPRTHPDGLINAQYVAIEQTLRRTHGLPTYIDALDGPGKFRPQATAHGWVWDEASRSYVDPLGCEGPGDASQPVKNPDTAPAPRRQVDLLAVGLEHQHPAVRAKAQIVVKAVDALLTAMSRHRDA